MQNAKTQLQALRDINTNLTNVLTEMLDKAKHFDNMAKWALENDDYSEIKVMEKEYEEIKELRAKL